MQDLEAPLSGVVDTDKPRGWPRLQATISIFGCTVAGGLVALPDAFQEVSLLAGCVLVVIGGMTTALSIHALAILSEHTNTSSYGGIATAFFGPAFGAFIDFSISLLLVGVISGSVIVLKDYFAELWVDTVPPSCAATCQLRTTLSTAGTALVVLLPLSLPRRIGVMAYASAISITAFAFIVGVLVVFGAGRLANGTARAGVWMKPATALQLGECFRVIVYATACQMQVPAVFAGAKPPRDDAGAASAVASVQAGSRRAPSAVARFVPVAAGAVLGMVVLFSLTAIFGVLAFGVPVKDNVLVTLKEQQPTMGGVAYLCLSAAVALACPLLVHPTRDGIISLVAELRARVGGRARVQVDPPPLALHVGITVGVIALSTTIALTFSEIMVLFGFLGAFALCPLAFLFPAACLLRLPWTPPAGASSAELLAVAAADGPPSSARARPRGEAIAIAVWLLAVGLATIGITIASYATGSK